MERLARAGVLGLSSEEGLALFDRACALGEPLCVGVRLDTAALRGQARAGVLPALLRDLVRSPPRGARRGVVRSRVVWRGWARPSAGVSCWSWCVPRRRSCLGTRLLSRLRLTVRSRISGSTR